MFISVLSERIVARLAPFVNPYIAQSIASISPIFWQKYGFAKKYFAQKKLDLSRENIAKIGNWLYGKGFEWNIINKALSNLKMEIEVEDA